MDYRFIHASPVTEPSLDVDRFDLRAAPRTDLWRKPASESSAPVESHNAPSLVRTIPIETFVSAQVTLTAQWTRLYDQGGLVIYFTSPDSNDPPRAWIKTGIEFYNNRPNLSTVATPASSSSDWSLVPLEDGLNELTLRIERKMVKGAKGPSLWVYRVGPDGEKLAVREITWAFAPENVGDIHVGAYAARPTSTGDDSDTEQLVVHFTALEVPQLG